MNILNYKYHSFPILFSGYLMFSKIKNSILVNSPTPPFNTLPFYVHANSQEESLIII